MHDTGTVDPEQLAKVYGEVAAHASRIFADYVARSGGEQEAPMFDEFGIGRAFMDLWASWLANPYRLAQTQMELFRDYLGLWQSAWLRAAGVGSEPAARPAPGDNRFRADDWQNQFLFDFLKQSYLITARRVHDAVRGSADLSPESRKKVDFFTRQYIDAMAPTNFALTNPQVIKETLATGGMNLIRGLNNLLRDIDSRSGALRVKMVDDKAFEIGVNVASAPGKVVWQNELMQLIQFAPVTATVHREPLLIIPPWINKYYILDLRESNSFIRWAVAQGHTVFVISWVNPDAKLAGKGFEDYMIQGPLAALDAIVRITAADPPARRAAKAAGGRAVAESRAGAPRVNVIGYCLGGTLLGATLGYLAKKRDARVNSATFFVSLLDFSVPGELGVFIDEQQVENLERRMNRRGYLEGSEMAQTFNMLRSNDLVWSFVINNYLLGREPLPFDLLYWNADSTRMPAKMHAFYLRNMYLANKLVEPDAIELAGVPIDLSKVAVPAYFISTAEDHIAPWVSTYRGARSLGGPVRFVLGGSGHIAGIVNAPAANKYGYWAIDAASPRELPSTAEAWREKAIEHPGSWWPDWQTWVEARNGGGRVAARVPGAGPLKAIEDAPGSYVRVVAKG